MASTSPLSSVQHINLIGKLTSHSQYLVMELFLRFARFFSSEVIFFSVKLKMALREMGNTRKSSIHEAFRRITALGTCEKQRNLTDGARREFVNKQSLFQMKTLIFELKLGIA